MTVRSIEDKSMETECITGLPDRPVAVVGAGLTGASWAALFSAHGRCVRVHDHDPAKLETARERIHQYAAFLKKRSFIDPGRAQSGLDALEFCRDLSAAVEDAVFIQECAYETYDAKQEVFRMIDRVASPEAIIATSSSGLSISRIQTAARYPERCLAGHPYNPPHLIPLVEVAPGEKTSPAAIHAAKIFYESMGKCPVVLKRDIPGYLANRMSAALWREAINLVLDGVASVEDVDRAVSLGPGLRWAVMGPHLIYHLGGGKGGIRYHMDHLAGTKEAILNDLNDWKTFPPNTAEALAAGLPHPEAAEALCSERDEKLAGILRALEDYDRNLT